MGTLAYSLQGQPFNPICNVFNYSFNTGINLTVSPTPSNNINYTMSPIAVGGQDPFWRASTTMNYGSAGQAVVFSPYGGNLPGCAPYSPPNPGPTPGNPSTPYSNWITSTSAFPWCGIAGNYSCASVPDMYFSRQINLPTTAPGGAPINAIPFKAEMLIFASDWVYDIWISNSAGLNKVWDSNLGGLPVTNYGQRNIGIYFSWCDFKPGSNIIYIHVKTGPFLNSWCKNVGIKVEAWPHNGTPPAPVAYVSATGPTSICAGTSGIWSVPNTTAQGYPASTPTTFSWQNIPGFSGSSPSATIGAVAGTVGGILVGSTYKSTLNGLYCLSTGGYSVTVPPPFVATASSSLVCAGKTVQINASGATSYTWINAVSGQTLQSGSNPVLALGPQNAPFTIKIVAKMPSGCIYQKLVPVQVAQNPYVSVNSFNTVLCQGTQSANLWAGGSAGNTYSWAPLSLPTSTQVNVLVQPNSTTVYTLIGTSPVGCTATAQVTVTVNPSPTIAAANPSAICSGTTTTITASGGTSYTWSPPTTIGPGPIIVTPSVTTIYTVTGKNSFNCTKTVTVQVNVNASPSVAVSPTAICLGLSNTLTATGAMNYTLTVWPTASPLNTTVYPGVASVIITPSVPTSYSVCGKAANGCMRCISGNIPLGTPVPLSVADLTMCSTASNCTVVSAGTSSNVTCTWSLPGSPTGNTVNICPPSYPMQVVVTATSTGFGSCPNTATFSISQVTNCCGQSTVGLTYISAMQGTMANTSYLLDHPVTLGNNTFMKDAEVWITPNGKITVPTGKQLDLDHVHLFSCTNYMWEGIKIEQGAMLTTPQMTLNQHANSLIEDAKVAIDVDYSTYTFSSSVNFSVILEGVIFNKNNIGIRIANTTNSVTVATGLGINGCIFSSRNMPFTSFPQPLSWPSSAMVSPGLKVAMNPTTGLNAPYIFPGMPSVNTKPPFGTVPGYAGLQLKNLTGSVTQSTLGSCHGAVIINMSPGSSIYDDFVLFDGLSYGIDAYEASIWSKNLVFQNMDPNTGGDGIRQIINGTTPSCFEMFPGQGSGTFGMRVWDCVKGLHAENVYDINISNSLFRSTHNAGTALFPNMPGDYGIYVNTNRFYFNVVRSEFNNVKKGVSLSTPVTPQYYDMNGGGPVLGVYADLFYVWACYFGAQVSSSTPYTGGQPNNTEYMETAVELLTPNPAGWVNAVGLGHSLGSIMYNKIDRAFRGINVDCMWDFPLNINENSLLIEDDYTFGAPGNPAFGYGISLSNSTDNKTISTNTLEAMGNAMANNSVSLVYCDYNLGNKSPNVHCNMTKNAHYGFQFNFRNIGALWEGNRMCNEWAGLALTNNGVIGQQGNTATGCENFWEDSPNNGCSQWFQSPGFPSRFQTYCDASFANLSPLYVFPAPMAVPGINGFANGGTGYSQPNYIQMSAAHNMQLVDCAKQNTVMPNWRMGSGSSTTEINRSAISFSEDELRMFPNPTDGLLNIICSGEASNCQVIILDLQGRLIYTKEIQSGVETSVDLKDLPASVYLLEIKQGTKVARKKLIKTN